jgi:hypothetical protein
VLFSPTPQTCLRLVEKTVGNLVPLAAISPTRKTARQSALVAKTAEPSFSNFDVPRFVRGLAVQSCGGMSNLLLPPGHVVG